MCRSSWVIGCLVALAAPSRAAPLLDLSRPLPSSSALPSLHAEWTTPIAGLGPAGDAAHAQSILLARPIGRQGLVVALDASSGHAAWPRGRELDDRDGASAIVGDDIVFFDRSGDVAIARLSDGQRRFTIRGTRCERGRIAGSGKLALAFCYRSRGGLLRADSDAREEAEWLTIDLDAGQLRSRSPADAMAVGLQCGATLCVAELVGFSGRAKRRVEQRALDLVAGKALWSTREDGQLLAVRGQSVVLLYRRKIVIFDAQTGRMHWGVALRAWQSTSGMTISPAYVDDSSITIVQPSVIETHDLATGTTRGGVTLPQLPVDANVFVTRAGAKLLAFVSGGDLGDGYLLVYDGGHASLVAGFGSPQGVRIIDDRLFVARHLETLSSYSLSLDRLDPPKPRSDAPPAPAIEIEADARIRYAPEDLPPRRGRDAILADQVRTAPDPIATEALDALEKLRSPMLRAVAEDVLRKPWTAARRGLVDRAIDE
ncbi:MAG TPA: hypothetical protein VIA18_24390, partial [Polyangia bacterium]|nr:hypothetical protein [Polyangia bacterium]